MKAAKIVCPPTCPRCCGSGYIHTHGGEKDPSYCGLHDRKPCPRPLVLQEGDWFGMLDLVEQETVVA